MPATKIIYTNLHVEMVRRNVMVQEIAEALGKDRSTVSAKLSGKRQFTLQEAFAISKKLFSGLSLEYLFGSEKD